MANQWKDRATEIRQGEELQTESLQAYLLEHLPGANGNLVVEQFPKGFSNLTYLIRLGEQQFVLRRPPFGAKIKSAHDMGREYRILSGLMDSYSKVPRPLVYCTDEAIIGAPFYVMERVEGVILRAKMPKEMHPDPTTMKGIAISLVDTLVELHEVDYQAIGLGDLGRPDGYIERQISGWRKRYFNAKTDEVPDLEMAAEWLANHMPKENKAALIHNDFKYDNVVLDLNDWTKITAVLDWEMATLGDPMMDLGTSIAYWVDAEDPDLMKELAMGPTTLPGNPGRKDVVEMYAQKSGQSIDHIVFYYAYGLFKLAVVIQQIYARYKKGYTQDKRFAGLIHGVKGLGMLAKQAIQKNRIDDLF